MLSFGDAPGNYFNRIGRLGKLFSQLRTYQNAQDTNMTDPAVGVVGQFDGEPDIQAVMGSQYINVLNSTGGNIASIAQQIASLTANRMVFRDNPRLNQTLQSGNLLASLLEIIRQMEVQGATVLAQTVSYSTTQFNQINTNTGNAVINLSTVRPIDGKTLENSFSENLTFICTSDSYINNATAGNEGMRATGAGTLGDVTAFDWPLGSNANQSLNAINGGANNTQGNLLNNSGFEDFTSNIPDNWEAVVGTGGTNFFQETTIVYDPTNDGSSLRIVGDASGTLSQLRQVFEDSDGTVSQLSPLSQYSYCLFIRRDGTAPAAGVLTIDLVDDTGTVILDMNGVANSVAIDLTLLNTVFTPYLAQFRTPHIMPDTYYIRMRLTTALTDGRSVYLDRSGLGNMIQLYSSGPYGAVHSGNVNMIVGDYGLVGVTNSRGAAGTLDTFQTLFQRLYFNLVMSNQLLLPSSSVPTISDNLITS